MKVANITVSSNIALFSGFSNGIIAYDRDSDSLFRVDAEGRFTHCAGYRTIVKNILFGPIFFDTLYEVCSLVYTEERRLIVTAHDPDTMEVVDILSMKYASSEMRVSFVAVPRNHLFPWIISSTRDVITTVGGNLKVVAKIPHDSVRAFANPDGELVCEMDDGTFMMYDIEEGRWTPTRDNIMLLAVALSEQGDPVYFTTTAVNDDSGIMQVKQWIWERFQNKPKLVDVRDIDDTKEVRYSGETVFVIDRT